MESRSLSTGAECRMSAVDVQHCGSTGAACVIRLSCNSFSEMRNQSQSSLSHSDTPDRVSVLLLPVAYF